MEGLWLSEATSPSGSWRLVLRREGAHWVGDIERLVGALFPKVWRLHGRPDGAWVTGTLERDGGAPPVQVQFRQIGAERLAIELRWPDGLVERTELIRP